MRGVHSKRGSMDREAIDHEVVKKLLRQILKKLNGTKNAIIAIEKGS